MDVLGMELCLNCAVRPVRTGYPLCDPCLDNEDVFLRMYRDKSDTEQEVIWNQLLLERENE
jgi:hypothetical protein